MRGESSDGAEDDRSSDAVSRARLQGKRAALALVVAVAIGIIGASAAQIIPAVFGWGIRAPPPAPVGTSMRTCADGIRTLADTIDHGIVLADWDRAEAPIARACAESSEGLDAWAALMRLRSARLQLPHDHDAELASLRRDVDAHIAAELR